MASVRVIDNITNYGLIAVLTIKDINSTVAGYLDGGFPLPKPFEHIVGWFEHGTPSHVLFVTSEDRPEELTFSLNIRGRESGWQFNLSNVVSQQQFGLMRLPSDLSENWTQADGSVILECASWKSLTGFTNSRAQFTKRTARFSGNLQKFFTNQKVGLYTIELIIYYDW